MHALSAVCSQESRETVLHRLAKLDPDTTPGSAALYELAQDRQAEAARICAVVVHKGLDDVSLQERAIASVVSDLVQDAARNPSANATDIS